MSASCADMASSGSFEVMASSIWMTCFSSGSRPPSAAIPPPTASSGAPFKPPIRPASSGGAPPPIISSYGMFCLHPGVGRLLLLEDTLTASAVVVCVLPVHAVHLECDSHRHHE